MKIRQIVKRVLSLKSSILYILFLSYVNTCFAQDFTSFDDISEPVSLESLDPIIEKLSDSVKVLGLGESSHYTKQYYLYKHGLISKLLKEKNFEAVLFEVDFGTAYTWNNYVVHDVGNLDTILQNCAWWTYQTEEFRSVLLDIHEINKERTKEEKIRVFGMEMTYIPGLISVLDSAYSYAFSGPNVDEISKAIQHVQDSVGHLAFSPHSPNELNKLSILNRYLNSSLSNLDKDSLSRYGLSLSDLRIAANMLNQFTTYTSNVNGWTQLNLRDQFSFENIQWFRSLNNIDKCIIWAHSGHVQNSYNYLQLGARLKYEYKDEYYSIGFDYGVGENGSRTPNQKLEGLSFELDPNSASFYLFNHFDSDIYIDLYSARKQMILDDPLLIRNTLSEYTDPATYQSEREVILPQINDGLIFIRKVSLPKSIF